MLGHTCQCYKHIVRPQYHTDVQIPLCAIMVDRQGRYRTATVRKRDLWHVSGFSGPCDGGQNVLERSVSMTPTTPKSRRSMSRRREGRSTIHGMESNLGRSRREDILSGRSCILSVVVCPAIYGASATSLISHPRQHFHCFQASTDESGNGRQARRGRATGHCCTKRCRCRRGSGCARKG